MNACDHDHMTKSETRLLPYGGGGNLIVCKVHYEKEMRYRQDRNREVATPYPLPAWETLAIYAEAE